MKTISIFLALVNALLAGLLISFLVTSVDFRFSATWWSMARILLALAVIVIAALTWIGAAVPVRPGILLLGSLFLVAIGPATAVWTLHRALLTGDMEYYMFMYGGSLFVQGITLLLGIPEGRGNASAAQAGR
ncbi:MAG TPA: hypothetical protein VHO49_16085 [Anaerolineales bacterium]|nr:hypothetical protein [Anaerolineales bacterium]